MQDDKLYFDTAHLMAGADCVSEYYLDLKAIAEAGRGSQLYVNIVIAKGAQTYVPALLSYMNIHLCTHTAAPTSAHRIMAISENKMNALTGGSLLSSGLKCKVPLPSLGLLDHVGLLYDIGTGVSGCTVTSFLTLT
jgi:hypothetical protein